jgi:hypothetical protein
MVCSLYRLDRNLQVRLVIPERVSASEWHRRINMDVNLKLIECQGPYQSQIVKTLNEPSRTLKL